MGAVNYYTSDYITLGVKPYDVDGYMNDPDYMDYLREEQNIDTNNEKAVLNAIYEQISMDYDEDYANVQDELENHIFTYFNVVLKPGYYEGFTPNVI